MRFPSDRLPRPSFRVSLPRGLRPARRPLHPGVWAGLGVLTLLLFSVWTQSRVDRLSMAPETERQRSRDLESRVEMRGQQTQRFSSLREVEPRAARDLGLEPSEFERMTVLDLGGSGNRTARGFDVIVPEAHASGARGSGR